jgi:hypothetical protein
MKKLLLAAMAVAVIFTAQAQIPTSGLVYHFPFDNSGTAAVGTGSIAPYSSTTGVQGGAIQTSSTTSSGALPNLPSGTSARTVSLWFKNTGASFASENIFRYGSNSNAATFGAYFNLNGSLSFQGFGSGNDQVINNSTVSLNQWQHLVITLQSGQITVYLNGSQRHTFSKTLNTVLGNTFHVGGFTGQIDELLIYNRALTAQEVLNVYNSQTCIVPPVNTTPLSNLNICSGSSTTLTVQSDSTVRWYDVPSGGTELATGLSYTTPVLNATTSYYAETGTVCVSARLKITASIADNLATGLNNFWTGNALDTKRDVIKRVVLSSSGPTEYGADRFGNANQSLRIDSSHLGRFVVPIAGWAPSVSNMSIAFWFKFDTLPAGGTGKTGILGTNNNIPVMLLDSAGNILFNHQNSLTNVSHVIPAQPNKWYHIVYARAANTQESALYIDGASVFTATDNTVQNPFAFLGLMTQSAPSALYPLKASLNFDEVRIYTRTVNAAEAAQLAGFPHFTSAFFPAKETCSGDSLPVNIALSGSGYNYQWVFNGNNVGSNTPSYTIPSLVAPDTVLSVTVSSGCITHDFPITVKTGLSAPAVVVTPSVINPNGNQYLACAGDSLLLTPVGSGNLQWITIGGFAPSTPTFGPIYAKPTGIPAGTPTGTLVFRVRSAGNGCQSPIRDIFVTWLDFTNFDLTLDASGYLSPPNLSFIKSVKWFFNGNDVTDATNSAQMVIYLDDHGFGSYTCEVTTYGDCVFTSNAYVHQAGSAPQITAQPTASASSACAGEAVTLSVTATGSNLSYQWKEGNTNVGTNSNTYTTGALSAGAKSYSVVVSNGNGSVTSNTVSVTVHALPQISHQVTGTQNCPDVTINIADADFPVTLNLSWGSSSGTTVTANASPHVYTNVCPEDYTLIATDDNGCSATIHFTVSPSVGIHESTLAGSILLYPNPATTDLMIECDEEIESITITDVTGRTIIAQSKIINQKSKIDVGFLAEATYFIHLKTTTGKTAVRTFVKQ